MKTLFFLLIVLGFYEISAQRLSFEQKISWQYTKNSYAPILSSSDLCNMRHLGDIALPFLTKTIPLDNQVISSASIQPLTWEYVPDSIESILLTHQNVIQTIEEKKISHGFCNTKIYNFIEIFPLRYINGHFQILQSFSLSYTTTPVAKPSHHYEKFATSSVLASGEWIKLSVSKTAIHKLTYFQLKSWGIPVDAINPKTIKIYGNTPGLLPYRNDQQSVDDLKEFAIKVVGEEDNIFHPSDYILFVGYSPIQWKYDSTYQIYLPQTHEFSDSSYYFLTYNGGYGKRIVSVDYMTTPENAVITSFSDFQFEEKNLTNFLKSGKLWVGDLFDVQDNYNYYFNVENILSSAPVKVWIDLYARSTLPGQSTFTVSYPGGSVNVPIQYTTGQTYSNYANEGIANFNFYPSSDLISFNIKYNKPQTSDRGWLDKIVINATRQLKMTSPSMLVRNYANLGSSNINLYQVTGVTKPPVVWDITIPWDVKEIQGTFQNSIFQFKCPSDTARQFIFYYEPTVNEVFFSGKVKNQNLHGIQQADCIIVTPPLFLEEANTLAQLSQEKGINTIVASTEEIYNEFSAGSPDIVAIRNFFRMIYKRGIQNNQPLKYALLLGEGSYDNKNYLRLGTNYIPTFQSQSSLNPLTSYTSDDFYAVLDDNEGEFKETGPVYDVVDIGVGRLPVRNRDEIKALIKKFETYQSTSSLGDWRNNICFVADDEDGNLHMSDANTLANNFYQANKDYNVDKIFFDSYKQEATPGGQRYPDVNKKINETIARGALIMNYTGHGGEVGWSHERVLGLSDIFSWSNQSKLTLFFTATCEFSRWDDPTRISAGEYCLLNPAGGAVSLLSTTRLVYSSPNKQLNDLFYNIAFSPVQGKMRTLGEIYAEMKKQRASDMNARNFSLIGFPNLTLNYPKFFINTVEVNGKPVSQTDTLRALSKVTIKGYVQDTLPGGAFQTLSNFNGIMYPTIYEKEKNLVTLNNDGNGSFTYNLRANKLFKGKVSVKNGYFEFSFIVPRDIDYNYGTGRASYYADNGETDANGYFEGFVIGGTDTTAIEDAIGPDIQLYMNDEKFISGGITHENPTLLVKLYDTYGINMTGNGIGHDIVAILDNNTREPIVLNDYYEADLDSYQSGVVRYPFKNLSEGYHKVKVKAWDVYNNPGEKEIEFYVVKNKNVELKNVLNYPNPFTTRTYFWFEHNQAGQPLYVIIQIYTLTGRIVKTIRQDISASGFRESSIEWDGRDDYGDKLARGVYFYKITVLSGNGTKAEKIEKLVIL